MFNQIGGLNAIGAPLSPNVVGGESFIRHIGNDKLIFNFKSGSGTTVKDRSREGNDGTFGAGAAAPTWKRNSLYFDGGDYVDLTGISHGISTGEFSFCLSLSNFDNADIVIDQYVNRVFIRSQNNKIALYFSSYIYITDVGIDSIIPIIFQITRNSSGDFECYINGKSSGKGQSDTSDISYDGVSSFKLGSLHSGASVFLDATMYSFRILNKGLSGIEAQQIYLSQKFSDN